MFQTVRSRAKAFRKSNKRLSLSIQDHFDSIDFIENKKHVTTATRTYNDALKLKQNSRQAYSDIF
jgi:hypothetical protein